MMGKSSTFTTGKKFELLVNLDHFEKQSTLTKNVDIFGCGERATLFHHFQPS